MNYSTPEPFPRILTSSAGRNWNGLEAAFVQIPRGKAVVPGGDEHVLGMHFGRPVNADCRIGDKTSRAVQKSGDMDFVPAGFDGAWEDDAECHVLRLSLRRSLLGKVAEDLGRDPATMELVPRLRMRDPGIEAILWAIKADLDAATPADPLFVAHLANALAVRLIEMASATHLGPHDDADSQRLPARELAWLVEFIEANLDRKLGLADLATVAGVSVTRLKILFRNSTGLPVHQYVVRRRAEYARTLIATTRMPASEIALAAGFSHQSHMASTMRRLFGQVPSDIPRPQRAPGPNLRRSGQI
ncbi:helix-turn-helix transcriptional regulator [Sphingomonas sp. Sphisp140]|uniref:helix-turn-helix transcriptional regulator n=1 Tax=unclassified Sphingomonas TaxID=196159 RepID=UPI0039AF680B